MLVVLIEEVFEQIIMHLLGCDEGSQKAPLIVGMGKK